MLHAEKGRSLVNLSHAYNQLGVLHTLTMTLQFVYVHPKVDDLSVVMISLLPSLNMELTLAASEQMSVLRMTSLHECPK